MNHAKIVKRFVPHQPYPTPTIIMTKMTFDRNLRRTCNNKTQMHTIKKTYTQMFFLLVCGNNKNKRRRLVFVEEVMKIIIFYQEENEDRLILVANCEKGMEEAYVVVTSPVVCFL
jgi:hypothetical protein